MPCSACVLLFPYPSLFNRRKLMSFFFRCIPRGYSTKFYTGRVRPEAQPLILLSIIFDRKGIPYYRSSTSNSMVWLDYKMAYDMVLGSSILNSLEMVGAAKNNSNSNSMVNWKTVLTSGGAELGQVVVIRRDIFQKDSLSVLLFIVLMLPPTLVLRKMKAGWKMATDMRPIKHLFQSWMIWSQGLARSFQGGRGSHCVTPRVLERLGN